MGSKLETSASCAAFRMLLKGLLYLGGKPDQSEILGSQPFCIRRPQF